MSQSLSKMYVHITFHTKYSQHIIGHEIEPELYAYIGGIIRNQDSIPIRINGVSNHIHILAIMSRKISIAKLIEEIKRNSSRWMKTKDLKYRNFRWQNGYGCFSVSPSVVERTIRYIDKQKEHHRKISYQQEFESFLKIYEVEYNREYLWS